MKQSNQLTQILDEAVKPNMKRQKNSLLASAQETAKYQVKSKDILTNNQEQDLQVIDDLEQALVDCLY